MGATHIIAVNIPNPVSTVDPDNMFAVVERCFQVMSGRLEPEWRRSADVVISPDVSEIAWDAFVSQPDDRIRRESSARCAADD